jgi:uncharacterized protein YbjT (DUF2867 family)
VKVVLFGATGMVGQGVLRECLRDPEVERVVSVGRRPAGVADPKLREMVVEDVARFAEGHGPVEGFDAGFFCLGVSSVGRSEAEYRRVTFDLTIAVARALAPRNPGMTFVYVSGAGTDSTEHGRRMWARVKGATENALLAMPFKAAYMFRPGVIEPGRGIRSKTFAYRLAYVVLGPLVWLLIRVAPNSATTSERVGRAMIRVARDGARSRWVGTRMINELGR